MNRSRLEIAKAVLRLASEELVPIERLRDKASASTRALIRWATTGRGGVFLDAVHRKDGGWMSSFAALERFLRAIATSAEGTDDSEQARPRKDRAG